MLVRPSSAVYVAAILGLVLPMLMPAATAATTFAEGFETGLAAWTTYNTPATQDCTTAQAGLCSAKFDSTVYPNSAYAFRTVSLLTNGVTTVSWWFKGDTGDNTFNTYFDTGEDVQVHLTSGNTVMVRDWDSGAYCEETYQGTGTSTWMQARLVVFPGAMSYNVEIWSASGTLLKRVTGCYLAGTPTQITEFELTTWWSGVFWFDSISVDVTGTAPTAPLSPSASQGSNAGEINVAWSAPASTGSHAMAYYDIYRSTSSTGTYSVVGRVDASTRTYTDAGLDACHTYFYKVSARNLAGEGPQSTAVGATSACAPSAPSVTAAAGPGVGQITLSWNTPSDGGNAITDYNVYRASASDGLYSFIGSGPSPYTDSSLGDGATWYYQVRAVNGVGEGAPGSANAMTYTTPGAPQAAAAAPGAGQTLISWQAPSYTGGAILHYRVYRSYVSGGEAFVAETGNTLSYADATCHLGRICFYKVTAVNLVGEGIPSNEASSPGTALPPEDPGLEQLGTDSDGDGSSNVQELLGHSDPTNPASTPQTDDDCDGQANAQEADFLASQGIGHPVVSITGGGVTFDPNTLDFAIVPPTVSNHQEGSSSC